MMLDNSTYNKIKLIHELSCMIWFIDRHAIPDADHAGDKELIDNLIGARRDLEKHLEKLQKAVCVITQ